MRLFMGEEAARHRPAERRPLGDRWEEARPGQTGAAA
jgi:hypothetical protein